MGMNTASVQRLYVAYFNRPADPVGLAVYEAMLPTDRVATQAELLVLAETYFSPSAEYTTNFEGKSNSQIINQLYQNIFGREADAAGLIGWATALTDGSLTVAEAALQMSYSAQLTDATVVAARIEAATTFTAGLDTAEEITGYGGDAAAAEGRTYLAQISGELPTDDATIGAAKDSAIENVDASIAAAVAAGNSASNPGQTFTLTTGSNVFTGTSGDDTFDAGLSTGALQTLNSGDRLDGGKGTDSLFTVINQSATPAQLKDIEKIFVTSITNPATMGLANATGVESVVNQASQTALTLSGMSTSVAVTVQDTAIAGQVVAYSGVTGTADEATLTLQNVTGAATVTVAGIETLNLATAGTNAQTLANLIAANATTLNVSGSSALTFTSAAGLAAVATVDASKLTGALTLNLDTAAAVSVTGGSAADALTMDRVFSDSVAGGEGNDTITFTGAGTLDVADTIAGGDGTDTLVANITDLGNMTAVTAGLRTGFERISVSDALAGGTLTTANVQAGIDRVTLAAGGTGTLVMDAGDRAVVLGAALTGGLTVNDTGVALTDSATISNGAAATDTFGSQTISTNGYETLTINTSGTGAATAQNVNAITMTGEAGGTTAFAVTGSNSLITAGAITAGSIDASGLTGNAVLNMNSSASVATITGSGNSDTLVGDASSSIAGGEGNDTITGGSGNDTLVGGAGNDQITTGGGSGDNVDGGDGTDTVVATLVSGNVMVGGEGTDTLSLGVAATAATATGVSGFETLRSTAAATHDMALFLDNNTFTTVQGGIAAGGGALSTFSNAAAAITTLATTAAANSVALTRLVDTSSNSLNVVLLGNQITTAVTANNEETINLSTSSAVGATTVTTLTGTDLSTLNITGSNQVIITTLAANSTTTGSTLTVNGSANTGGISVSAANSTIVANMTGSELAANTLTGSGGSDTITGGTLADNITGGIGADVMTGGLGTDTFTFANSATGTPTAAGNFDTITDYTTGDLINGPGALTLVAEGVQGVGQAAISATGLASFNIADDTLAERLVATEAGMTAATQTANETAVFNFGSDAYVFISDGTPGVGATDVLIKLTGVTASVGMTLNGGDVNSVT